LSEDQNPADDHRETDVSKSPENSADTADNGSPESESDQESKLSDTADLSDGTLSEQLQEQLDKAREDVLRAAAEAQNARRRAEQDVEKARKFALERFVQDLLPVVDNLERAMNAVDSEDEVFKPVYEGIELTYKSFQDSLGRHQIVVVDPVGAPFDPEQHQAMSMVPNADVEPNTVLEVFQKGYLLNGRLVRPAMVLVSKAPD